MSAKEKGCTLCEEAEQRGEAPVTFKNRHATCFVCKKEMSEVLDLHHTYADLCSLECERVYWLDTLYS